MEGSIERILLDNLAQGNQANDPAPIADGPGWTNAPGLPATGSGAGARARAVALVPSALASQPAGEVTVLLHLHGLGKALRPRGGSPADVRDYQMPQQIQNFLASRPAARLVAIMPIGISIPTQTSSGGVVGTVSFGGFNSDALIAEVLTRLTSMSVLPAGSTPGGVILSAHSGGGLDVSSMMRGSAGASPRLPRRLIAMFAFESVHGDINDYKRFIRTKLDADLVELRRLSTPPPAGTGALPGPGGVPSVFNTQAQYLRDTGFRFMGFGGLGTYRTRFAELETSICQWFADNDAALHTVAGPHYTDILNLLWANYHSATVTGSTHSNVLEGTLSQALASLPAPVGGTVPGTTPSPPATPPGSAPSSSSPPAVGTVPASAGSSVPVSRLQDADTSSAGVSRQIDASASPFVTSPSIPRAVSRVECLRVFRQVPSAAPPVPAASTAGDLERQLIDEASGLGRQDGLPVTPVAPGHTLLRSDDIRAALLARAAHPELQRGFDLSLQVISAIPDAAARAVEVHAQAEGLVMMLENQFILDPSRSALDLLPPARALFYRNTRWGVNDYPGHGSEPPGPLEGRAAAMAQELARIRPERRPNVGADAVLTSGQATAAKWAFIDTNLVDVPGQPGHRLYREAASAFSRMHEVAAYDGVDLHIVASWRSRGQAAANASGSGNPAAVASFSSHSLGLAVDLRMSAGGQTYQETTTHPMQNVADMRSSPAHKWMVLRGESFGWFPYGNEPWHWEYNPPGLRDRFWQPMHAASAPGQPPGQGGTTPPAPQ